MNSPQPSRSAIANIHTAVGPNFPDPMRGAIASGPPDQGPNFPHAQVSFASHQGHGVGDPNSLQPNSSVIATVKLAAAPNFRTAQVGHVRQKLFGGAEFNRKETPWQTAA